mmetsp:Transcript_27615/g.62337  ORF Transcript_27615/g.62337 Transcript_27615/m.62337 type:complete len:332 (+) Transcript_27615:200-1195(+)
MPSLHDHLALDVVFDKGNEPPAPDRDLTGGTTSTVDSDSTVDSEGRWELPIGPNTSYVKPAPARNGDHLRKLSRTPSKSILRKESSYSESTVRVVTDAGKTRMRMAGRSRPKLSRSLSRQNFGTIELDDLEESLQRHYPRTSINSIKRSKSQPNLSSCDSGLSKPPQPIKRGLSKRVSFDCVNVRSYDRCAGDNPGCRFGVPLSLDWSYTKSLPVDINEFEQERSTQRSKSFFINKYIRKSILLHEWGIDEAELKERRKETKKIQRQRDLTRALLPVQLVHEILVNAKTRVKSSRKDRGDKLVNDDDSCCTEDMSVNSCQTWRSTLASGPG